MGCSKRGISVAGVEPSASHIMTSAPRAAIMPIRTACPLPRFGGGGDHLQRRAACGERAAERDGSVGRAIVDNEDLEAAPSRLEEGDQLCDGGPETMFFVVGGDDDGEIDGGGGHRITVAFCVGHGPTTNANAIPTARAHVAQRRAPPWRCPNLGKPCPGPHRPRAS